MRRGLMAVACALLGGCLDTGAVECADGRLCPEGLICLEEFERCVRPEQLTSCQGADDGTPCDIAGLPDGVCVGGYCLRASCGDGLVTGTEECDFAADNSDADCTDLGYYDSGPLACATDCTWDDSTCTGTCLDGAAQGDEACDRDDLRGLSCGDFGFYREDGGLVCTNLCTVDTSGCADYCGDLVRNGPELCDGAAPSIPCTDFGFDAGRPGCAPATCTPAFDTCVRFDWSPVTSLFELTGQTAQLNAIHGASADNVWAAGVDGVVVHYDGASWQLVAVDTARPILDIWVADNYRDVWAVTPTALVHYDGTSWSETSPPDSRVMFALAGTQAGDIYVVGETGALFRYDGASWSVLDAGTSENLNDIAGSGNQLVVVGTNGVTLQYDGTDWTTGPSAGVHLNKVAIRDTGRFIAMSAGYGAYTLETGGAWVDTGQASGADIWADFAGALTVGAFGITEHWDGTDWQVVDPGVTTNYNALWGSSMGEVWAVDQLGGLWQFRGAYLREWEDASDANDVWGTSANVFLAMGDGSVVYRSTVDETSAATGLAAAYGIWGAATDDLWAVGSNGGIAHWDGTDWSAETVGTASLYDVDGADAANVWAVGASGAAAHFDGTSWTPVDTGAIDNLRAVWVAGPDDAFAVGDNGAIARGGTSGWSDMTSPSGIHLRGVWGSSASDVWAVGREVLIVIGGGELISSVVLHYDGTSWSEVEVPENPGYDAVVGSGPNDVLIAGRSGTVLHYDGVAWSPVNMRTFDRFAAAHLSGTGLWLAGATGSFRHLVRATELPCPDCSP